MASIVDVLPAEHPGEEPLDVVKIGSVSYADDESRKLITVTLDELDRQSVALTASEMPNHTPITSPELGREVFRPAHSPIPQSRNDPRVSLGGRVADIDVSQRLAGSADDPGAVNMALVDNDLTQFGPSMRAAQVAAESIGTSTRFKQFVGTRRDVELIFQRTKDRENVAGRAGAWVLRGILTPYAPDDLYCLMAKPKKSAELAADTYTHGDGFLRDFANNSGIITDRRAKNESDRKMYENMGIDRRLLDPRSRFAKTWLEAIAAIYLGGKLPSLSGELEQVVQRTVKTISSYSETEHEPLRYLLRAYFFNAELDAESASLKGHKHARGKIKEIEHERQIMWQHLLISMTTYFGGITMAEQADRGNMASVKPGGPQHGFSLPVASSVRLRFTTLDDVDEAIVLKLKEASSRQKKQNNGDKLLDSVEKIRQSLIEHLKADRDTRVRISALGGNAIRKLRTPAVEETTYSSSFGSATDIKTGMLFSTPAHYPEDIVMATIKPAPTESGVISDGFDASVDLLTPELEADPAFDHTADLPRFVIISLKRTFGCLGREVARALESPEMMHEVVSRGIQLDEVLANVGYLDQKTRAPRARARTYRIAAPSGHSHAMDFDPRILGEGDALAIAHGKETTYPDFGTLKGQKQRVIRTFNTPTRVKQSRIPAPRYSNNATGHLHIGNDKKGNPLFTDNRLAEFLFANGGVHVNDTSHPAVKVRISPHFRKPARSKKK